jgi:hypothetical protein
MTTELLDGPPITPKIFLASMDDSPHSEAWITPFSIQHYLIGLLTFPIFKALTISTPLNFILANILHILYEAKDLLLTYRVRKLNGRYLNFNSLRNSLGDHIVFTLGQLTGWFMFGATINPASLQFVIVLMYLTQIILYITHSD